MDKLLTYITNCLRGVCEEAYHDKNMSKKVVYPYLTFDIDNQTNPEQRNQENVSIGVDIFDNNSSGDYTAIFALETQLKRELSFQRDYTADFGAAWQFIRASNIPTGQSNILRRALQIKLLIDWRLL